MSSHNQIFHRAHREASSLRDSSPRPPHHQHHAVPRPSPAPTVQPPLQNPRPYTPIRSPGDARATRSISSLGSALGRTTPIPRASSPGLDSIASDLRLGVSHLTISEEQERPEQRERPERPEQQRGQQEQPRQPGQVGQASQVRPFKGWLLSCCGPSTDGPGLGTWPPGILRFMSVCCPFLVYTRVEQRLNDLECDGDGLLEQTRTPLFNKECSLACFHCFFCWACCLQCTEELLDQRDRARDFGFPGEDDGFDWARAFFCPCAFLARNERELHKACVEKKDFSITTPYTSQPGMTAASPSSYRTTHSQGMNPEGLSAGERANRRLRADPDAAWPTAELDTSTPGRVTHGSPHGSPRGSYRSGSLAGTGAKNSPRLGDRRTRLEEIHERDMELRELSQEIADERMMEVVRDVMMENVAGLRHATSHDGEQAGHDNEGIGGGGYPLGVGSKAWIHHNAASTMESFVTAESTQTVKPARAAPNDGEPEESENLDDVEDSFGKVTGQYDSRTWPLRGPQLRSSTESERFSSRVCFADHSEGRLANSGGRVSVERRL